MNKHLAARWAAPDSDLIAMANQMDEVIMLQGGDPDVDTSQNIKDTLTRAMESGKTHYPPTHGVPDLRNEKILIRPGGSLGDHTESYVRVPLIRPVEVL